MKPALLVLAAGLGSRFGGDKQIETVGANGETLLDYSVYDALHCGFGQVVFVIRPDLEAAFRERLFDRIATHCDAAYVFQNSSENESTMPKGTLPAVLSAQKAIDGPFMVVNCDDWYGRKAFCSVGEYLNGITNDCTCHAMVGYKLRNTIPFAGTVSRAICSVEKGMLKGMKETFGIGKVEGDGFVGHRLDGEVRLTGNEIVSMNLFGFAPSVFEPMERYYTQFTTCNMSDSKTECRLPDFVDGMVSSGEATMSVLDTDEKWFGMTYRDDAATVRSNIELKKREGYYPSTLWS